MIEALANHSVIHQYHAEITIGLFVMTLHGTKIKKKEVSNRNGPFKL